MVHGQHGEAAALLAALLRQALVRTPQRRSSITQQAGNGLRKFIAAKGAAISTAVPTAPAGVVGGLAAGATSNLSAPDPADQQGPQ
jgi:hypothetical protein